MSNFERPYGQNFVSSRCGNLQITMLDLANEQEQREYVLFPARGANAQMIAVKAPKNRTEGNRFAIQLKNTSRNRMAYAIYINGVCITGGEGQLGMAGNDYRQHPGKILLQAGATIKQDHALLNDGGTPAICFVQPEKGFAQYSQGYDPKCEHQIIVFAWAEQPAPQIVTRSGGNTTRGGSDLEGFRSKGDVGVGFGQETNTNYSRGRDLENPEFVTKSIFVYWPESAFFGSGYDVFTVGDVQWSNDIDGTSNLGNLIPGKYPRVNG